MTLEKSFSHQAMVDSLHHDLLDKDTEIALLKSAQDGNEEAIEKIVAANQRLIYKIAHRFYASGAGGDQELTDLIQWGQIGLLRAIRKYDAKKDTRFSTYAYRWIESFIRRFGIIKGITFAVPFRLTDSYAMTFYKRAELASNLQRDPSRQEIADHLGVEQGMVDMALMAAEGTYSLDALVHDDDERSRSYVENLTSEDEAESLEDIIPEIDFVDLMEAVYRLDRVMRTVIILRYGLEGNHPLFYREIGQKLGVSKTRIQQIEIQALKKLRQTIGQKPLF